MTQPKCDDLLSCPDCGANPAQYCEISTNYGHRNPFGHKSASARCTKCHFNISIQTSGSIAVIRKLWNVRTQ